MTEFPDMDKVLASDDAQMCASILAVDATIDVSGPYDDVKALIHDIASHRPDGAESDGFVRIPGSLLDKESASWATREDWFIRRDTITAVVDIASYERGTRSSDDDGLFAPAR